MNANQQENEDVNQEKSTHRERQKSMAERISMIKAWRGRISLRVKPYRSTMLQKAILTLFCLYKIFQNIYLIINISTIHYIDFRQTLTSHGLSSIGRFFLREFYRSVLSPCRGFIGGEHPAAGVRYSPTNHLIYPIKPRQGRYVNRKYPPDLTSGPAGAGVSEPAATKTPDNPLPCLRYTAHPRKRMFIWQQKPLKRLQQDVSGVGLSRVSVPTGRAYQAGIQEPPSKQRPAPVPAY